MPFDKIRHLAAILRLGTLSPSLLALAFDLRRSKKTFLNYPELYSLAKITKIKKKHSQKSLQIAEFGVGRGGSAMLFAWMIDRYGGTLALFDVFGRIPPPSSKDGKRAQGRYQVITESEQDYYYGNVDNLLVTIKEELSAICILQQVAFHVGNYEDTLSTIKKPYKFDIIHIDCDWYQSVRTVLDYLKGNLAEGAVLQIDDYHYWPGTKKATDESQWLQQYKYYQVGNARVIDTGRLRE